MASRHPGLLPGSTRFNTSSYLSPFSLSIAYPFYEPFSFFQPFSCFPAHAESQPIGRTASALQPDPA